MRVVLDTNILFSALISPHGAPDAIYRAWRAARFEVVTSRMQLDEIRRASRYPKLQAILQPAKVGAMINNLQRAVVLERLTIEVEADDPDDSFDFIDYQFMKKNGMLRPILMVNEPFIGNAAGWLRDFCGFTVKSRTRKKKKEYIVSLPV